MIVPRKLFSGDLFERDRPGYSMSYGWTCFPTFDSVSKSGWSWHPNSQKALMMGMNEIKDSDSVPNSIQQEFWKFKISGFYLKNLENAFTFFFMHARNLFKKYKNLAPKTSLSPKTVHLESTWHTSPPLTAPSKPKTSGWQGIHHWRRQKDPCFSKPTSRLSMVAWKMRIPSYACP